MRTHVNLGQDRRLRLREALLIFTEGGERGEEVGYVSRHRVRLPEDEARAGRRATAGDTPTPEPPTAEAPTLGAGRPLGLAAVQRLAVQLGMRTGIEVYPEHLLARGPDLIGWWSPPTMRTFFYTELRVAEDASDEARAKAEAFRRLHGQRLPCPALVWKLVGRRLSVRAVLDAGRESPNAARRPARPTAATRLALGPFYNTYEDASVCVGTMRAPDGTGPDDLRAWEDAYFGSAFSHTVAVRLTSHPGGFTGLWLGCLGRRTFPTRYLVDAKQTVAQFFGA